MLPNQPSWNDTRQVNDWSWFDTGYIVVQNGDNPYTNYRHLIRKAHLVIDGAVVLEFPAGTCEEDNSPDAQQDPNHPPPWYKYTPWKLLPDDGATGMHVLAYPTDDYTTWLYPITDYCDPARFATNGVATASIGADLSQASDFIQENCYVSYLVGGTYSEGPNNTITVPLDITPDGISPHVGSLGTVAQGMTKRLRGGVQGLAFDENGKPAANRQIEVTTPGAPSNQMTDTAVTANDLGWFETPAINTKADAALESWGGTMNITTRNRFLSRLVMTSVGLGSTDFEITNLNPLAVEPAYNDSVQINWRSTSAQPGVQSILVLFPDSAGAVQGSDGVTYDLIATLDSGGSQANPAYNPPANPYQYIGSTTWQPPSTQAVGH